MKGPVWLDYDHDGWLDILFPGAPTMMFRNVAGENGRKFERSDLEALIYDVGEPVEPQMNSSTAEKEFRDNLAFAACVADFNQDGIDDGALPASAGVVIFAAGTLTVFLVIRTILDACPTLSLCCSLHVVNIEGCATVIVK